MRWEDSYRLILGELKSAGAEISPRKGKAREFIAYSFVLDDPRDRCLLSHAREFNVFQAVGHWLWIMAGRMDLPSINYYNPRAPTFSADLRKLDGAYGPRLFGLGVMNQIPHVIDLLKKHDDTRRAVASVYIPEFDSSRTATEGREDEVPCTLALQYLPRGDKLHAIAYMRSQDALMVLPYDLFIFTLLQEYIAASIGKNLGRYHHHAGSLHYYLQQQDRVDQVLAETTEPSVQMPKMQAGTQDDYLKKALELEEAIRADCLAHLRLPLKAQFTPRVHLEEGDELPDFWRTVVQCLVAWAAIRLGHEKTLRRIHAEVEGPINIYVERALSMLAGKEKISLDRFFSS